VRQSPNGRPLAGKRLNDTAALVARGINPPPARYELHYPPSAEAMVTPVDQDGARPDFSEVENPSPSRGATLSRAVDYLERK
jgi:hypothetical protein